MKTKDLLVLSAAFFAVAGCAEPTRTVVIGTQDHSAYVSNQQTFDCTTQQYCDTRITVAVGSLGAVAPTSQQCRPATEEEIETYTPQCTAKFPDLSK